MSDFVSSDRDKEWKRAYIFASMRDFMVLLLGCCVKRSPMRFTIGIGPAYFDGCFVIVSFLDFRHRKRVGDQ